MERTGIKLGPGTLYSSISKLEQRLRESTRGQPYLRNLDRWEVMIRHDDLPGLRRVMTGLDIDSVQMREVSPMGGLLSQEERSEVLGMAS